MQTAAVLHRDDTGTRLHAGMTAFPVRVALVVDNTLARVTSLAFHKCDYVAQSIVSDVTETTASHP
jgi:hypothetical protein